MGLDSDVGTKKVVASRSFGEEEAIGIGEESGQERGRSHRRLPG